VINKRLLIKKLLSHHDENSFYDKKQQLSLHNKEGKAKFLKHVCALSNSNPTNNSYIVIGVEDEANKILGVDFFDDSKIQNLANAYLKNPPKIQYENVPFPRLPRHKVVGLVTIHPTAELTSFTKNAWKYRKGTVFCRRGSNSMPMPPPVTLKSLNDATVNAIEKSAQNNIELTLQGVFDFMENHTKENHPQYKVFNEQFVLCWAGTATKHNGETFLSRVDIELVNEQVRLFFSALDEVQITHNNRSFIVTEFISLGLDKDQKKYPLEKTIIHFKDNGKHAIGTEFLFEPPLYDAAIVQHIYNNNKAIVAKIIQGVSLSVTEHEDVFRLPANVLICCVNGFMDAKEQLVSAKKYIKELDDKTTYIHYKEVLRVLRKIKYHS